MAASARAAHSNAPIFTVVAREHHIPDGHARWQTITFNNAQSATRAETRQDIAPPPDNTECDIHRAGTLSDGNPSSGSLSPRARRRFDVHAKASSGKYSSSHAARLNCVRA